MKKEKILMAWSSGKDGASALYELQKAGAYDVAALLTTVTEGYDRISMHGTRVALLEEQARSLGIPVEKVCITQSASNEEYEAGMKEKLLECRRKGVLSVAFGDIFLEDLRRYREEKMAAIGMKAVFPIWKRDTAELARRFISAGFKAIITCVDTNVLDAGFAGREFDEGLLSDLPARIDPCGENGEFHSFVYDGPVFQRPLLCKKGVRTLRDKRFYYCDILPHMI